MPNLCIDCKWYDNSSSHDMCKGPHLGISLVTGAVRQQFCATERENTYLKDTCGPEGRYWKQKEPAR